MCIRSFVCLIMSHAISCCSAVKLWRVAASNHCALAGCMAMSERRNP